VALREQKKMSVAALANRAGLPIGLILEYESGQRAVDPRHLGRLARALYVEESEIRLQSDPRPGAARPEREFRREQAPRDADGRPEQVRGATSSVVTATAPLGGAMPGAVSSEAIAPAPRPRGRSPRAQSVPRPPAPARASQIAYLDGVLERLSRSRTELEAELAGP